MTRILNRLTNLVLLELGILSMLSLMADSFGCRVGTSFWIWMGLACVLLWIAGSFRKGILVGMPLSAVLLYAAYRFYGAKPWEEALDFIDRISGAFYTHITHPGGEYPYANAVSSHALILLFLGFLLGAYLVSALTSKNLRIALSMLETVPIFAACVIVNGKVPAVSALGMLLFWFLLVLTGPGFFPDGNAGRTMLCVILPLLLVLGGLLMLHRPEDYVYSEHDRELSQRFQNYTNWFDLLTGRSSEAEARVTDPDHPGETTLPRSRYQSSWDSDDNSMSLDHDYDYDSAELRVMQVRAETSGRIYLRSKSYGDYTGTGWLPAEELSSGSSLPFTAFAVSLSPTGVPLELEVRTLVDFDELCIPYYAAVSSGSDVFVASQQQINYKINYTDYSGDFKNLTLPSDAANSETVYQTHAHSVYTRLPEETRSAALAICQNAGLRADDPNIIPALASYVQNIGEYDLNVSSYPSDDYAIYFLTQSRRGYCIHYATAAAVLYRSLGIPARVTEGFVAQTQAGLLTDVLARDAHAWVEVYLDGVGWIPVEVTHQSGFASIEIPPTPTMAPSPTPDASSIEPVSEGQSDEQALQPDPGSDSSEAAPSGGESSAEESRSTWKKILIAPALILALFLWYWLARARFQSQVNHANARKAVLACWRYARRAATFGGEMPQIIVDTAEKVAFSPHMIRKDELAQCREALQTLIDRVYPQLHLFNKFRFRVLRGMR